MRLLTSILLGAAWGYMMVLARLFMGPAEIILRPALWAGRACIGCGLVSEGMDGVWIYSLTTFLQWVVVGAIIGLVWQWKSRKSSPSLPWPKRVAAFFRRPWPVEKVFWASVVAGTVAPAADKLLYDHLPWQTVPFVFFPGLIAVFAVLWWQVKGQSFRQDSKAMWFTVLATGLVLPSLVGSGWCYSHHICMDGHMAHPPYSLLHYCFDAAWASCLVAAVSLVRWARVSLCLAFGGGVAFVLSNRFLFGSLGGVYDWFPL